MKWSITEKFSDYLKYAPKFVCYTDNNPLTYVLTTAKLNAAGLRWVAELADYNFVIKYRPGKVNIDSDYLSRNATSIEELMKNCTEVCEPSKIDTILSAVSIQSANLCNVSCKALVYNEDAEVIKVETEDLVRRQREDVVVGPVYQAVLDEKRPDKATWKKLSQASKLLMHHFKKLDIREDDVLIRKLKSNSQIVLPDNYHQIVYTELHENMAHLGADKVIELAQQRFYWPYMAKQITHYIRKKCRCIVNKKPNVPERAPLVSIEASRPFQMVAIDFCKMDKANGGFEYVLVVSDHFTRFTQAYATKSKSSKAAAIKLFEFILQYGYPERIHHDRGPEFNSDLFKELHRLSAMKMSNTTPYHPMGNGQIERLNRTFCNMLKSLKESEKKSWNKHLSKFSFAYNSTVNKSTGFSPFYLMFGRYSVLPIDYIFPREVPRSDLKRKTHQQFVDDWTSAMNEAFTIAREHIKKSAEYNKSHYDKKVKVVEVVPGDHVLIKNVREKGGTGKLKSYWEPNVFVVLKKDTSLPVYTLKNLNKDSDRRVIHRNLLMKCNDLPVELFQPSVNPGKTKQKKAIPSRKKSVEKKNCLIDQNVGSDIEDDAIQVTYFEGGSFRKGRGSVIEEENVRVNADAQNNENEDAQNNENEDAQSAAEEERGGERVASDDESQQESDAVAELNTDAESPLESDAVAESDASESEHDADTEPESNDCAESGNSDAETDQDAEIGSQEESADEPEETEGSSSDDNENATRRRHPARIRQKPKVFTYNEIGGDPVIERYR